MNKEEILESRFGNYAKMFGGSVTVDIFCSMDEWAEQTSIEFADWKDGKGYECTLHDDENIKHWQAFGEGKLYTTKELFKLFRAE